VALGPRKKPLDFASNPDYVTCWFGLEYGSVAVRWGPRPHTPRDRMCYVGLV